MSWKLSTNLEKLYKHVINRIYLNPDQCWRYLHPFTSVLGEIDNKIKKAKKNPLTQVKLNCEQIFCLLAEELVQIPIIFSLTK